MKQRQPLNDPGAGFRDFVDELEDALKTLEDIGRGQPKKSVSLRLTEDDLEVIDSLYERTCCALDLMPGAELGETKYPSKAKWLRAVLYAGLNEFRAKCRHYSEKYG